MLRPGTDRKYAYILLFAALSVLGLGLVLKPNQPEQKSPPSESELAQLQRLTQQRRLRDLSSYLTEAADAAASSLLFVGQTGHSGVLWDAQPILITAKTPSGTGDDKPPTTVAPDGGPLALQRTPLATAAPFLAFTFKQPPRIRGARKAARQPDLGDWVLVVARNVNGGIVFAHGIFQGIVEARCGSFAYRSVQSSTALSRALLGGGAFTLDGQLLGIVAECERTPIVIAAETVAETLKNPPGLNRRLEDFYGIRVSDETVGGTARSLNAVQVVAVWTNSRGDAAGLRPGDAITSANAEPVHSRADLESLLAGDQTEHQLTVQRGRQRLRVMLSPDTGTPPASTPYGFKLSQRPRDRQVRIVEVTAGSSAQQAGILSGDVLVRVGNRSVPDAGSALRALADTRAAQLLTVERDGREYEVLVKP
jgi:S1-C subfamily serine protease